MPSVTKPEEIEEIDRASMIPVEFSTIITADPMIIQIAKGRLSRNLLIRAAVYDTVQQRTILPIKEMKVDEVEMRKIIMVRMPNMDGEK